MRRVSRSMPAPPSLSAAKVPKGSPKGTKPTTELDRAKDYFALPKPASGKREAFPFAVYKSDDVKDRLMADFHFKCAYCESRYAVTAPIDVEHYRPKGRIKEHEDHDGYWWLAMSWDNLLPSCIHCNRHQQHMTPTSGTANAFDEVKGVFANQKLLTTGKQDSFPITGKRLKKPSLYPDYAAEGALLLDPCRDDPEHFLHFYIDAKTPLGVVLPKAVAGVTALEHMTPAGNSEDAVAVSAHAAGVGASKRGAVSIQTYGLNRLQLVRERTRILRQLEFLEHLLIRMAMLIQELQEPVSHPECEDRNNKAVASLKSMQAMITGQIRNMAKGSSPYSAMVKAWVRDFRIRTAATLKIARPHG